MKTKIKTKRRIVFCGVAAVFLLTMLFNFVLAKQRASAATTKGYVLTGLSKNNSYKLTLEKVGSWAMPSGYTRAQGFAINDKDFVVITEPSGGNEDHTGKNKIVAIKRNTQSDSVVKTIDLGHGNGATWDSTNKQLLVVDGTKVHRFDKDYKYIDAKSTLNSKGDALNATGIAYDNLNGQYWTSSGKAIRRVNMSTWKASTIVTTDHT